VISGQKNSHTDTSNEYGVFCSTASPVPIGYAPTIHSSRLMMPEWAFIAPLGRPVEPDV
jgi:hypothetical protein